MKNILGFLPHDIRLYQLAFVHKSASGIIFKNHQINNERLEYLGDAILDAIVAEYLYKKFPEKDEGFLTRMRSKIVNRDNLNAIAIKLGLSDMIVSKMSNDNHRSIYGDALEALVGALYIDLGFNNAKRLILERIIQHHVSLIKLQETETDFKSRIIEWGQKNKKTVNFTSYEEYDDVTNGNVFISHLIVVDEIIGRGIGTSKKDAEQNAARQALKFIEG
ncbi:MAG: ribonuclease III [Bacteroidales bacterium]|nr:ribonuclease III [Bacteroidales bacterium]MBN2764589.1 ribonuclease III [Bacteroidales bacterium]